MQIGSKEGMTEESMNQIREKRMEDIANKESGIYGKEMRNLLNEKGKV